MMSRNYLRVRGEYGLIERMQQIWQELPPRARRIRTRVALVVGNDRTTSACAENTANVRNARSDRSNYLRVRGEYKVSPQVSVSTVELPPRARRILTELPIEAQAHGTTSACAENTIHLAAILIAAWNYLRVRGEYPK